ncbi:unnamed protein product [Blepharisma stoltei]|uniref:Serine/threonine-protein phosphatase 2A 55 kDa regulatory subunit B n=1 Tax=Blepharisma stoltei TaxID=1481888 RepID=A0AAU9J751_9CILI|nr:unnamed protein product [Blepharisma stoltei]
MDTIQSNTNPSTKGDTITCLKFSRDGDLLAIGDGEGIIHLLKSDFREVGQIEAHSTDLDSYKKPVVSPCVRNLEFLHSHGSRASLFSSNEKTIKLWKIFPVHNKITEFNTWEDGEKLEEEEWLSRTHNKLIIPSRRASQESLESKCVTQFLGAHQCYINSVSLCSNYQNFVSADDLKIFLWDINRNDTAFLLVDQRESVKPISEVITSVKCHQSNSHIVLWTSTNGTIRIGDLRDRSICDNPAEIFKYSSRSNGFFDELVLAISSADFCQSMDYIVARDYFTVKYWDMRNCSSPAVIVDVMSNLQRDMNDLYQSQDICAKFEVKDFPSSEYCVTGGYSEVIMISRMGEILNRINVTDTDEEILHMDVHPKSESVVFACDDRINQYIFNDILLQ